MTRPATLLAGFVLVSVAGSAHAQNALGDGRGLQRTGVTDRSPMDFSREVRLRNAVVTGNAPAGRSLQIASPYSDADDFRAALGTDSLFRFRRDSYGGGLGVGFRGTESIQYQYTFSTGNTRDPGLVTRLGGVPGSAIAPPVARYGSTIYDRGGSDTAAPDLGTLRSTASFNAVRGLSPAVVGLRQTREGVERVTASSLLGVRSSLLVPDMMSGRYVDPEDRRAVVPAGAAPAAGGASSSAGGLPAEEPKAKTAYDELMERLRARPEPRTETPETEPPTAPAAPATPEGATPGAASPGATPTAVPLTPEAAWDKTLREMRARLARPVAAPEGGTAFTAQDEALLEAIRASAGEVSAYLTQNPNPGDLYGEHVAEGEAMIGSRQYFDAEERFARALAMRPGDVAAMAGRMHAQLGGGLYLSAAMNLRLLLGQHPEVAAVRFTGGTLPDAQRLAFIKAELAEALNASAAKRALPSPESALLLAYVGFQTGDGAAVERGLRVLDVERAAQAEALGEPPPAVDPLVTFLRAAWLGTPLPTGGKSGSMPK